MSQKKLKTVEELVKEKSIETSNKLIGKDGKLKRKLLKFKNVDIYVLENTLKALEEIKEKGNISWEKAVGFMLDAGTVIYHSMGAQIRTQLQKIKEAEENASSTGKTKS